jgi:TolB-like protein
MLAAMLLVAPIWAAPVSIGKVWVETFSELNQPQQQTQQPDWINRALVQSVSDDLSSIKGLTVTSATTRPADADYVVSGTIQRVSGELRVTGRVEDTSAHQLVGGFKATGGERDLFAIEDAIATQLKYILAPQAATTPTTPLASQPSPTTANTTPTGPFAQRPQFEGSDLQRSLQERDYLRRMEERNALLYQPVPDYTYNQPVYPVDYGYGYGGYNPYGYTYPYGWWGGSVVIINGQRHFRNDRNDHDHSHHWNHNGGGNWGSDFVANPGGSPTQTLNDNGQRIRQAASFGGVGNAPSVMVNTPTSSPQLVPSSAPQLVPTRGIEMTSRAPQMVPSRSPQLVPSGGPQLVPGGGGGRR